MDIAFSQKLSLKKKLKKKEKEKKRMKIMKLLASFTLDAEPALKGGFPLTFHTPYRE